MEVDCLSCDIFDTLTCEIITFIPCKDGLGPLTWQHFDHWSVDVAKLVHEICDILPEDYWGAHITDACVT